MSKAAIPFLAFCVALCGCGRPTPDRGTQGQVSHPVGEQAAFDPAEKLAKLTQCAQQYPNRKSPGYAACISILPFDGDWGLPPRS